MKDKTEREIEFLRYQQESLKYGFDKYVDNYHHSMMWIATLFIGFTAILISLGYLSKIWIIFILYIIVTSMRLFQLVYNTNRVKGIMTNFDEAINKRYFQLGLNLNNLKKEIKLTNELEAEAKKGEIRLRRKR